MKAEIKKLIEAYGISSGFGYRELPGMGRHFHNGIDIPCPAGTRVVVRGEVIRVWWDAVYGGGLSAAVIDGGYRYGFAHLSAVEVQGNEVVLVTGNTGRTTGPHLHFTVYNIAQRRLEDPAAWAK